MLLLPNALLFLVPPLFAALSSDASPVQVPLGVDDSRTSLTHILFISFFSTPLSLCRPTSSTSATSGPSHVPTTHPIYTSPEWFRTASNTVMARGWPQ